MFGPVSRLRVYRLGRLDAPAPTTITLGKSMWPEFSWFSSWAVTTQRVVPNWDATFALKALPVEKYRLCDRTRSDARKPSDSLLFVQRGEFLSPAYPALVSLDLANAFRTGLQGDVLNVEVSEPVLWLTSVLDVPLGAWSDKVQPLFDNGPLIGSSCDAQILRQFVDPLRVGFVKDLVKTWHAEGGYFMTPYDLRLYHNLY
jgi:hypothetical protein